MCRSGSTQHVVSGLKLACHKVNFIIIIIIMFLNNFYSAIIFCKVKCSYFYYLNMTDRVILNAGSQAVKET